MLNTEAALSFANFKQASTRNNFHLHFVGKPGDHLVGDIYRKQSAYVKCMQANPDAFGYIARELRSRIDTNSEEYLNKLYKAYLMMYPYAKKNWDMFM